MPYQFVLTKKPTFIGQSICSWFFSITRRDSWKKFSWLKTYPAAGNLDTLIWLSYTSLILLIELSHVTISAQLLENIQKRLEFFWRFILIKTVAVLKKIFCCYSCSVARTWSAPQVLCRVSHLETRDPNCIALFGSLAAPLIPNDSATNRRSRFSPSPRGRLKSAWNNEKQTIMRI